MTVSYAPARIVTSHPPHTCDPPSNTKKRLAPFLRFKTATRKRSVLSTFGLVLLLLWFFVGVASIFNKQPRDLRLAAGESLTLTLTKPLTVRIPR